MRKSPRALNKSVFLNVLKIVLLPFFTRFSGCPSYKLLLLSFLCTLENYFSYTYEPIIRNLIKIFLKVIIIIIQNNKYIQFIIKFIIVSDACAALYGCRVPPQKPY